jgi:preprotein translocase subunit SecA
LAEWCYEGKVAEMQTGEGKNIGKHLYLRWETVQHVTVNDYLAKDSTGKRII